MVCRCIPCRGTRTDDRIVTTSPNQAADSSTQIRARAATPNERLRNEALGQSARLSSLVGLILLLLVSLLASPSLLEAELQTTWVGLAWITAALAALSGPLMQFRLNRGASAATWRLFLLVLMSSITAIWVFASVVALADSPVSVGFLVVAWLALSVALMPSVGWLPGLAIQLLVQLAFTLLFGLMMLGSLSGSLLAVGLWLSLVFLSMTASLYARRVRRAKKDLHYLRIENDELQQRLVSSAGDLASSAAARRTLEAELAEILTLAEDANRAKTEFLATMSHEIRTPLNGILPILEMLQDTRLDKEQQRLVRTAQGSSRHLLRIINDILDFAKVESGKLQLEAIEIDVRELIDSVIELMRGSARNRNLQLSVRIADNVPAVVRGDPIRLRQVLINLVSNAIKFTEEGGVSGSRCRVARAARKRSSCCSRSQTPAWV
jgi:signal transduction histidine kinase